MNEFLVFLLLPLAIGCGFQGNQTNNVQKAIPLLWDESQLVDEPYGIDFKIEKLENDEYSLEVAIDIEEGSYFMSPHTQGSYMGRFTIAIENNDNIMMADTLLEIPKSIEEIDKWTNSMANFVRQNTVYKQKFTLQNKDAFEIEGLIQFVIEPRCTMEKIGFIISNRSGKLDIKRLRE